jgi:hypothetical protein
MFHQDLVAEKRQHYTATITGTPAERLAQLRRTLSEVERAAYPMALDGSRGTHSPQEGPSGVHAHAEIEALKAMIRELEG